MCRRHGHVGAYAAVDRADFALVEQRGLKWHPSSPKVRRGFCAECGSALFDGRATLLAFCPARSTTTACEAHIFVASKGDYYPIADDGLLRLDAYS
jgi:hypothetical protein